MPQFIRLVTSANLRRNANDILPFLFSYENDIRVLDPNTGLPSVENFCTTYVEAADSEADHIAIQALTNALGLTLDVAQLDQSSSKDAKQEDEIPVDFVSMQGGSGAEQSMDLGGAVLLLRPGHYDLLLP